MRLNAHEIKEIICKKCERVMWKQKLPGVVLPQICGCGVGKILYDKDREDAVYIDVLAVLESGQRMECR